MDGLPDGVKLDRPQNYGADTMRKILRSKDLLKLNGMRTKLDGFMYIHTCISVRYILNKG